jgi:hypothetical protein
MKHSLYILLFLLPFFGISQENHFDQQNAIKISPFEFGQAQFEMAYERYFGDRSSSIMILPSIYLKDDLKESKTGFQIGAQYRVFLSHLRSDQKRVFLGLYNIGFYAGVYAQYLDYEEDYQFTWWDNSKGESFTDNFTKDISSTEGGAILGVQFDITNRILIDFYVGGGIRYSSFTDTRTEVVDPSDYHDDVWVFDPEYKGVKPKIGFQIGFMF